MFKNKIINNIKQHLQIISNNEAINESFSDSILPEQLKLLKLDHKDWPSELKNINIFRIFLKFM